MLVRFSKMHGIGNDFVMLDLITQNLKLRKEQIRQLADRHCGIGFDQLLAVEPPTDPDMDFRYRIYNADGSEAEHCGNGARCLARFVHDRGLAYHRHLRLQTSGEAVECELLDEQTVRVNMGRPAFAPALIPFEADHEALEYLMDDVTDTAHGQPLRLSVVSMGNPHAVLLVPDVASADIADIGPRLQQHRRFPQRVNVGFLQIEDQHNLRLRVYERGVGETLACGSAACAAMVVARRMGQAADTVTVHLPGGDLSVEWVGDQACDTPPPVYLTGPAVRVFDGQIRL